MDINIFFARFHAALATVGRAGRGFSTTDLLTSLREELIVGMALIALRFVSFVTFKSIDSYENLWSRASLSEERDLYVKSVLFCTLVYFEKGNSKFIYV